jgi:5,5'-dehydrodivanillate O-demethylase oxygenase subunit
MWTRVELGTPCGELMRRYWHPIAATGQLEDNPVRKVRMEMPLCSSGTAPA